jgi:hypothetical protein
MPLNTAPTYDLYSMLAVAQSPAVRTVLEAEVERLHGELALIAV